jgi:quercetin dioxygenase-like cupin family protein
MTEQTISSAVVLHAGEGTQRWFFGGGVWTWKSSSEDGCGLHVVEVDMDGGKCTPLHVHPVAESMWVLEGQLRYRIGDDDVELGVGDFVMVPADVPHAFIVVSEKARVLAIQPGHDCEAFYLGASEPLEGSSRTTDFDKIGESGRLNGGITLLGPPPF